jgi:hypothetical protein
MHMTPSNDDDLPNTPWPHPQETSESLKHLFGDLGNAILQKIGLTQYGSCAEAIGRYFKDHYGGWRNISETIERDRVSAAAEVRALDPADFHTAEGFDVLMRKIRALMLREPIGTSAFTRACDVFWAIKSTISENKDYAKMMDAYEQASDLLKQMEGSLVLDDVSNFTPLDDYNFVLKNDRARALDRYLMVSPAVKKLRAVLSHNVSPRYKDNAELAKYIEEQGAPHLMHYLANRASKRWGVLPKIGPPFWPSRPLLVVRRKRVFEDVPKPSELCRVSRRNGGHFRPFAMIPRKPTG